MQTPKTMTVPVDLVAATMHLLATVPSGKPVGDGINQASDVFVAWKQVVQQHNQAVAQKPAEAAPQPAGKPPTDEEIAAIHEIAARRQNGAANA